MSGQNNMISRAEHEAAIATSRTEAVTAERTRIKAITSLEEAKGRGASALQLALTSDMTADGAKAVLSGLPVEAATSSNRAGGSSLGLALGDDKGPGAGGEAGSWDKVLASRGFTMPGAQHD